MKKNPVEAQLEVFQDLLESGVETLYGRDYGFSTISSIQDFQSKVPINDYVSFLPYLERVRAGEYDVLWPGKVDWFAKSSGTTNAKSKFIPITTDNLKNNHFKCGKDIIAIYSNQFNEDPGVLAGKSLVLGGSHSIHPHSTGKALEGDLSAIIIENLPIWVNMRRIPSKEVALMDEWEQKLDKMADEAIQEDIRSIAGVPSWTTVLLKKVLEKTGKQTILEVWPNLELFIHGGVSFTPYKNDFERLIGGKIQYLETYNASEGFFGIQDKPERDDMLLSLNSDVFYEFIPIDEYGTENPTVLTIADVEIGAVYAVIISTSSGLWRYDLGDTITFTDTSPYRFKIKGRTKHYINTFGEELMVENAETAISKACSEFDLSFKNFTAGPRIIDDGACGYHHWIIEFEQDPKDIDAFIDKLDIELQTLNSDYQAKRYKNMVLQPLKLTIARESLFHDWLKNKGKLGGQHKVPRLSNDAKIIDSLISLNEQN
jgi:hypothetical protein